MAKNIFKIFLIKLKKALPLGATELFLFKIHIDEENLGEVERVKLGVFRPHRNFQFLYILKTHYLTIRILYSTLI